MASKRRRKQKQFEADQLTKTVVSTQTDDLSPLLAAESESVLSVATQEPVFPSNAPSDDSASALPFAGAKDLNQGSAFEDLTDKPPVSGASPVVDGQPNLEVLSRRGQFMIVDLPQLNREQALAEEMAGLFDDLDLSENRAQTPDSYATTEQSVIAVLPTITAKSEVQTEEWFDESQNSSLDQTFQSFYDFKEQPEEASILLSRSGRRRRRTERSIAITTAHVSDGSPKVVSGSVSVHSAPAPRMPNTQEVPKIILSPDTQTAKSNLSALAQTTQTPVLATVSSKNLTKTRKVKPVQPEKRRSGMLFLWSALAVAAIALAILLPLKAANQNGKSSVQTASSLQKPNVPAQPSSLKGADTIPPTLQAAAQPPSEPAETAPSVVNPQNQGHAAVAVAQPVEAAVEEAPVPLSPETMAMIEQLLNSPDEEAQELAAATTAKVDTRLTAAVAETKAQPRSGYDHVPPAAQVKAPYGGVPPMSSSDAQALAEYLDKRQKYEHTPPKSSQDYVASIATENLNARQRQKRYDAVPPRVNGNDIAVENAALSQAQMTANTVAIEPRHYIQTQPSGVGVYINGKRRGFTPFSIEVDSETEVTLLHPDYLPSKVVMHPQRGSRLHHMTMTPR